MQLLVHPASQKFSKSVKEGWKILEFGGLKHFEFRPDFNDMKTSVISSEMKENFAPKLFKSLLL